MKPIFIIALCLMTFVLKAQESQMISTGSGYNQQSYVNLAAGTEHRVANASWDIAFSVAPQDAGVFINESVGSASGALPIQAFFTLSEDFNVLPAPSSYEDFPLYNREVSWSYGAINDYRDGGNPNDYGWGVYNPTTQEIDGIYVYVIKLRDGSYLKFQIQSLINGEYTFRYANTNGSGEVTKTISKADHVGKMLAYFSFATGETVDVESSGDFDLLFCRYYALLQQGADSVQYLVTGILSAAGVEVAEANHVDPATVQFQDYADSLSSNIEIIGHDWKYFDLNAFEWILPQDLVYFVKTKDDRVWKLKFVEFQGSGTGTAVFEKTDLGIISAVENPSSPTSEFLVYPNPASNEVNVLYTLRNNVPQKVKFQILDASGRFVDEYTSPAGTGFNVFTIHRDDLLSGIYFIRLLVGEQSYTSSMYITR
jgi:hypothetical protein